MRMKLLRKCIAVVLCITLILGLASCGLVHDIRHNVSEHITNKETLPIQELTRLLICSINDSRTTPDSYSAIPESQLDGLSYSYFYEYMNIMRSVSRQENKGNVKSFRIMSVSECLSILGQDLFNTYGQITGAELIYSNEAIHPVYIFFRVNSDGTPSLSSSWITSVINIYNYGNHYFNMLDEENNDGVIALISPGFSDPAYTNEALFARATELIKFYRLRVMSNTSDYEITTLVPDQMVVRIPNTVADDGVSFEDHYVTLDLLNNGNYRIDDNISVATDSNLVYLMRGDERLLRVGTEYSYLDMINLMGEPSSLNIDPLEGKVMVVYPGLILRFDGEGESADNWTGTLTSVRIISNSTYSIGYFLYIGMSKTQILIAYPFIDSNNYSMVFSNGTMIYELSFVFDEDGKVVNIRLTV